MKYIFLTALFIMAGCDTPTRSRFPSASSIGNPVSVPFETTSGTNSGTTTGSTTGGTSTNTPGFENCNLTKSNTTADTGSIGICRSSLEETVIRFVSSKSHPADSRLCFIPTYKDSSGSSTYLGDPQCTEVIAEKVYTGRLYKNRQGFSATPFTGVMIMRIQLVPEYFQCMDAYSKYIANYCPASPNYPPCVQYATNERTYYCNLFKSKYPNNFLDIYIR